MAQEAQVCRFLSSVLFLGFCVFLGFSPGFDFCLVGFRYEFGFILALSGFSQGIDLCKHIIKLVRFLLRVVFF